MTPTAKQQLEDLLNEALDEQRQLAIRKLEGIINKCREKYMELHEKEFILRKKKMEEVRTWYSNFTLKTVTDKELDQVIADETAYLHVINLLKEELNTL